MKKFNRFKVYISSVITLLVSSLVISFVAFTYAAYLNHETHKHTINVKIDYSEYFDKSSQLHTYVIKTPEHINNLSKLVAMGVFGPNDTFLLGGNIDCSTFNDPLIPIGSDDTPFYSVFDGQGYTISNLKVVGNDVADVGMFGYVANGATIKNFLLDSPIVSVTGSISNYSADSYLIRNNNPFRKKFGEDLYTLAKSFSLNPSDNTEKNEFTKFQIKYDNYSNTEFKDFPIKAYVSKSNILTEGSDFNFTLQESYSGDSQYFTIEMYIEGLVLDSETNNYFYSRISLEKFKVYLNVVKDSNGKITSIGFVKDPEDIHVYKKTIETLPTHIITDKPYNYYNQHVVNAGIVVGHLDGNASYIGVKNGILKANNRPYRSNSILIGKKIDDDDVSSLSREHVNFTENAEIGDELHFGSPSTKAGAIEGFDKNKQMMENDLFTAIQNGEGCMLRGHLDISKVPGDIHVSFHSYRGKWNALKARRPDLASKINMAHQFISLSFGNMEQYKLFKYGILPRSFYRYGEMPDFLSKNINQNYIYYIKLIPYTFIDENNGSINHSYQYSISYKEQEFDPREDDMPIVLVKYEFSPVTMRVTIPKRDYLHFLTHVCAIVGGIFVVFSILNRFLVGLFDFSGK